MYWTVGDRFFGQHLRTTNKTPGGFSMRPIVTQQFGGPEQLVIQQLPAPEPAPDQVVIEVKAFGINHAETHMRKGEWPEAAMVSGIECVGLIKACPDGQF